MYQLKQKWHNNLRWKLQNIAIHMTTENSPMTLCGFENRKWKSKTKFNESLFIDWFKKKHLNQGNGKYIPEFLNYFLSPWESKLFYTDGHCWLITKGRREHNMISTLWTLNKETCELDTWDTCVVLGQGFKAFSSYYSWGLRSYPWSALRCSLGLKVKF